MNKKLFLTFGCEKYYGALNRINNQALSMNSFDEIIIIKDTDLPKFEDFWDKHKEFILSNKRGYGYWIWKSYLVMMTLENMNNNDILVYADSGCQLNITGKKRLFEYFDIVNKSKYGILSFQMPINLEKKWCKMDLLNHFNCNDEMLNKPQLHATNFIIRKCDHTLYMVKLWYELCCNYHFIDDSKSILNNDESFSEHRHDQSIFSLIRRIHGSEIINDENYNNLNYPIFATRNCKDFV